MSTKQYEVILIHMSTIQYEVILSKILEIMQNQTSYLLTSHILL